MIHNLHIYLNGSFCFHTQTLDAKRILIHCYDFTVKKYSTYFIIFRIIITVGKYRRRKFPLEKNNTLTDFVKSL